MTLNVPDLKSEAQGRRCGATAPTQAFMNDVLALCDLAARLAAALKVCDAMMIRPAHVFSCGAYKSLIGTGGGAMGIAMTGECTCGVDAAHAKAESVLKSAREAGIE